MEIVNWFSKRRAHPTPQVSYVVDRRPEGGSVNFFVCVVFTAYHRGFRKFMEVNLTITEAREMGQTLIALADALDK